MAAPAPEAGPPISTDGWGVSLDWTDDEQRTLEAALARLPPERVPALERYVRAATALPRKSVRDVALRARWTALQVSLKRRTTVEPARRPGAPPRAPAPPPPPPPPPPLGGGAAAATRAFLGAGAPRAPSPPPPAGEAGVAALLDANLALLHQFRANMAAFRVAENTALLVRFRDNILAVIAGMEAMGGVMARMPPLPVKLNVDLANNFLPSRPAALLGYDSGLVLPPPPQPAVNAPGMVPLAGLSGGGGARPLGGGGGGGFGLAPPGAAVVGVPPPGAGGHAHEAHDAPLAALAEAAALSEGML